MTQCIIQLHGVENVEDAMMYADFAADKFSAAHALVFSVQSSKAVFDELALKMAGLNKVVYVGAQRRTFEEFLLYYTLSGLTPSLVYDAISEECVDLVSRYDAELCSRLKLEYEKCADLFCMSGGVMAQVESVSALVSSVSNRAQRLSFILSDRLSDFSSLINAENSLARGLVSWTVNKISTVGQLDCGAVNMFEEILNEYRVLGRLGRFKPDFIDDRMNLLLALASSSAAAHDVSALVKYLLVQSAYSFSLSKSYLKVESNLAALFAFRSFEFLALSMLVSDGKVLPVFNGRMVFYELNGKSVMGVKDLWNELKAGAGVQVATSQALSSFITVRNRSYLGHGFFHSSSAVVDGILSCLIELVNKGIDTELKDYWMIYKKCSRGLRVKDAYIEQSLDLSL